MGERDLNSCFLRGNPNAQLTYEKMLNLLSYGERKLKPQQILTHIFQIDQIFKSDNIKYY